MSSRGWDLPIYVTNVDQDGVVGQEGSIRKGNDSCNVALLCLSLYLSISLSVCLCRSVWSTSPFLSPSLWLHLFLPLLFLSLALSLSLSLSLSCILLVSPTLSLFVSQCLSPSVSLPLDFCGSLSVFFCLIVLPSPPLSLPLSLFPSLPFLPLSLPVSPFLFHPLTDIYKCRHLCVYASFPQILTRGDQVCVWLRPVVHVVRAMRWVNTSPVPENRRCDRDKR